MILEQKWSIHLVWNRKKLNKNEKHRQIITDDKIGDYLAVFLCNKKLRWNLHCIKSPVGLASLLYSGNFVEKFYCVD